MLQYKVDILAALKDKGYSSYRMRKDKIFGERVIQQLRDKEPFSWEVLSRLCLLLECQPGDLLVSVPEAGNCGEIYENTEKGWGI